MFARSGDHSQCFSFYKNLNSLFWLLEHLPNYSSRASWKVSVLVSRNNLSNSCHRIFHNESSPGAWQMLIQLESFHFYCLLRDVFFRSAVYVAPWWIRCHFCWLGLLLPTDNKSIQAIASVQWTNKMTNFFIDFCHHQFDLEHLQADEVGNLMERLLLR